VPSSVFRSIVPVRIARLVQTAFAWLLASAAGPRPDRAKPRWRGPYAGFDAPTYQRRGIRIAELETAA